MSEYGLVGFFDILGYQNIIDNNKIEDTSTIIADIIHTLPSSVKDNLIKLLVDENKSGSEESSNSHKETIESIQTIFDCCMPSSEHTRCVEITSTFPMSHRTHT